MAFLWTDYQESTNMQDDKAGSPLIPCLALAKAFLLLASLFITCEAHADNVADWSAP